MNNLYNSGRLQQALGDNRATDMLQAVDAAHLRMLKIKANQNLLRSGAKVVGGAALGAAGYEGAKHFLGGGGQ